MVTLADSLVSSSARRMPIRKRPDLSAKRQRYLGRSYWIVKDPVGLNYFRFQDEEFAILNMLDGETSLDEIKEQFEAEFPPQKITLEELQQFLGQLHRSGLVVAGVPGQGRQLRKRRDERRRKEILAALTNILCIRFKGVDPERFLNWLYPYVRWIFSPVVLIGCLLLGISALGLILVEFEVFRSKLPSFYQFFSPTNALLLAATLGVTKVLHELGHGLTCKHFGGECHEIGVMILVLTPCLYCNVSDSWMLPNKWHRALIGAAGIFVELTLASIATFLWWFTEPGLLHYLCLNVMFISSVSTILFNANPLLRYDGYYILSDVTEIPNLRQKATSILSRKMGEWCMGIEPPEDPFLPERNQVFFALYSVAAVIYRWFILLSILMFLYKVFEPYGLKILGQAIAAMSIWGLVFQPISKLVKFFYVPGRWYKVKKLNLSITLAGLGALVAAFFYLPLPYEILAPLQIEPRDATTVYVPVAGTLEAVFVEPGDRVSGHVLVGDPASPDGEAVFATIVSDGQGDSPRYNVLRVARGNGRFVAAEVRPQDLVRVFADEPAFGGPLAEYTVEKVVDENTLVLAESAFEPRTDPHRIEVWRATPLARLSNPDLEIEVARLEGERNRRKAQLENLQLLRHAIPNVDAEIRQIEEALQSARQQLAERQRDLRRLLIRAPVDGTVFSPPWVPDRKGPDEILPTWSGTPLEKRNLGAFLQQSTQFCLIGDPARMKAVVVIDQADLDFVAGGDRVEIKLDELPAHTFAGRIDEIAPDQMKISPRRLSTKAGGELSTETDTSTGAERPMSVSYQASVHLDDDAGLLRNGVRGTAKIHVAPQTLGRRCWRLLTRTFNFEL